MENIIENSLGSDITHSGLVCGDNPEFGRMEFMSDHLTKTIEMVNEQIIELERELREKKRMVNSLRALGGLDPFYNDAEETVARGGSIRSDQFYGKPLATAARQVLEIKGQAVTVSEIYGTMLEGGYKFESSNKENAIRTLRISLSKNTAVFHKLPNGTYGLLSWYPNVKVAKPLQYVPRTDHDQDDEEGYDHSQFDAEDVNEPISAKSGKSK